MKNESNEIIRHRPVSGVTEQHLEEFSVRGYTVIEGMLTEPELSDIRKRLDEVYNVQVKEAKQNNYTLEEINEQNIVRMPFAYDETFLKLLVLPVVIDYINKIIGNYFILQLQNGIIIIPDEKHHQGSWHRDLPYQYFISSKPLSVNALFCIDDFSEQTGATCVLPFSHKMENFPSEQYVAKQSKQVKAPAGSVILMDSMVFHRAGDNSSSAPRRAINQVYVSGILKQQINIPVLLNGKYRDDLFLKMLLGYDAAEPNSVNEYRLRKLKK